jgi:hypothetical protein
VTFTATVNPATAGLPPPSGTVQFQSDGVSFGAPVNLVGGQAISPAITTLSAGRHTITALYANDPNYHDNSGSTSQMVDKAHLTVTADDQAMTYGGAVPALTDTITGFVNGDTAAVVGGAPGLTTTATSASGVGSYAIAAAPGTLAAANYNFPTLVAGTLRVTPAPLTVTADDKAMTYSGAVPALTYTITGFVNRETAGVLSGAPSLTTDASSASGVGSYAILVSPGSLAAANYDFPSLAAGVLHVTPAPLTIRADDLVRAVGQSNPTLTASYSGFVNGDGPSSLASPAVLSTTATADSPPGVYPITVGAASSHNYSITFLAGTLTVIPPSLVTMTNVQEVFNKRHQVAQITIDFSGPLDAGLADSLANYILTVAGKHGSFTARNARAIPLASAVYSESTDSVTLALKKRFGLTRPIQVRIRGLRPGDDIVVILSKQGVRIEALQQPGPVLRLSVPAVGHLMSAGGRAGALHPLVAQAPGGWRPARATP